MTEGIANDSSADVTDPLLRDLRNVRLVGQEGDQSWLSGYVLEDAFQR